ncbi:MAG: diguanylate cyclase [Burkholderiales bacterium]|nr:diguanylate cyclase [Burkholderiales bacterium]
MRYSETSERSAELLRLAIAQMGRHAAACNPITYTVWYEYVAGINEALRRDVEHLTQGGRRLDDEQVSELFDRHVVEITVERAREITGQLNRAIGYVTESTEAAGGRIRQYGSRLNAVDHHLLKPDMSVQDLRGHVESVARGTREMQDVLEGLHQRLVATREEVDRLKAELAQAREEVLIDALTGLCNRRGFDQRMESLTHLDGAACLIIVDVDRFKQVNDSFGHVFGDRVLRAVADTLRHLVKGRDVVARFGGEEFAVLLPETTLAGGRAVAEQIRAQVERVRIRRTGSDQPVGNITVSAGVAQRSGAESAINLIQRADAALYAAKANGRNCVTVAA